MRLGTCPLDVRWILDRFWGCPQCLSRMNSGFQVTYPVYVRWIFCVCTRINEFSTTYGLIQRTFAPKTTSLLQSNGFFSTSAFIDVPRA